MVTAGIPPGFTGPASDGSLCSHLLNENMAASGSSLNLDSSNAAMSGSASKCAPYSEGSSDGFPPSNQALPDGGSQAAASRSKFSRNYRRPLAVFHRCHGARLTPAEERCTHCTLTRVYTDDYSCHRCGQFPKWGWIYRCVEDMELGIRAGITNGDPTPLDDDIFAVLAPDIAPTPRGPEAREKSTEILAEMSPRQRQHYTPIQQERILNQRIQAIRKAKEASIDLHTRYDPTGETWSKKKLWAPTPGETCRYRICHYCLNHNERTFESLDGVAKGDLSVTSVTGFPFWDLGRRPVNDVRLVRRLGLRSVNGSQSHRLKPERTMASMEAIFEPRTLAILQEQEFQTKAAEEEDITDQAAAAGANKTPENSNLIVRSDWCRQRARDRAPPTPELRYARPAAVSQHYRAVAGLSRMPPSQYTGSTYITTAAEALGSHPSMTRPTPFPHQYSHTPETTRLPEEDRAERMFLEETPMMEEERRSGHFHREALNVQGGVAFTEDGVEEGIPDVRFTRAEKSKGRAEPEFQYGVDYPGFDANGAAGSASKCEGDLLEKAKNHKPAA